VAAVAALPAAAAPVVTRSAEVIDEATETTTEPAMNVLKVIVTTSTAFASCSLRKADVRATGSAGGVAGLGGAGGGGTSGGCGGDGGEGGACGGEGGAGGKGGA